MRKWWKKTIPALMPISLCRVARCETAGPQSDIRRREDAAFSVDPFEENVCNLFEFGRAVSGIAFPKVQVQNHHDKVTLTGTVNNPRGHAPALSRTVEEQPEWKVSLLQQTQFPIT